MSEQVEPKRVLIIEDNMLNQKIADMVIKQLGHETIQVFEGKDAVRIVREEMPDLIILDVKLPDSSGTEICRKIKDDAELKVIPVIIVTALSEEDQQRQIVAESKCDFYLAKPFLPHMFAEAIAQFIQVRSVDWGL